MLDVTSLISSAPRFHDTSLARKVFSFILIIQVLWCPQYDCHMLACKVVEGECGQDAVYTSILLPMGL